MVAISRFLYPQGSPTPDPQLRILYYIVLLGRPHEIGGLPDADEGDVTRAAAAEELLFRGYLIERITELTGRQTIPPGAA